VSEPVHNPRLEAALACDDRGWKVIPIPPGRKAPARTGWQNMRLTRDELHRHFANGNNIGVLTGKPSGNLVDTDLDWDSAARLASEFLPPTDLTSGRNKRPESHYWYTSEVKTKKFIDPLEPDRKKAMIVEVRSRGCQTVIPPSTHPEGDTYRWDQEGEAAQVAGTDLTRAAGKLAACCLISHYWTEGKRHALTLPLAVMLCRAGWLEMDAEHFVRCAAWDAGDPEARDRLKDVRTTYETSRAGKATTGIPALKKLLPPAVVDSIVSWLEVPAQKADTEAAVGADFKILGIKTARGRTDSANALRLILRHGDDIRYCPAWESYLTYNGTHWEEDSAHRIEALAKHTASFLWSEVAAAGKADVDQKKLREMTSFARASSNANSLRGAIWAARSDNRIHVEHSMLDAHPMLFNTKSGTVDLETGKLRPHCRGDYLTKMAPVAFEANATSPRWDKFLLEVFPNSPDLVGYLQLVSGYCLTGLTIERCLFFLLGHGRNGKTTAVTTLKAAWQLRNDHHDRISDVFPRRAAPNGDVRPLRCKIGRRNGDRRT
jgi:putative DNA primase/helicase